MIRFIAKEFNYQNDPSEWGIYAEGSYRPNPADGYTDFEDWIYDDSDLGVVKASNICMYLNTLGWDTLADINWNLIDVMVKESLNARA